MLAHRKVVFSVTGEDRFDALLDLRRTGWLSAGRCCWQTPSVGGNRYILLE